MLNTYCIIVYVREKSEAEAVANGDAPWTMTRGARAFELFQVNQHKSLIVSLGSERRPEVNKGVFGAITAAVYLDRRFVSDILL